MEESRNSDKTVRSMAFINKLTEGIGECQGRRIVGRQETVLGNRLTHFSFIKFLRSHFFQHLKEKSIITIII